MDETNYNLLNSIKWPADLRKLSVDQLPLLCDELRNDIVKEVSMNPGHLASSLGVVELTVALHYVFNTPDDRIVWDVGHQAYGHKILTGRREAFCTNRKLGGLMPFPSPKESEYDTFTCGHASNSISAALGEPEHLIAYNTYQVKNYDRYELAGFSEEAKRQWRDEHWEKDLQKAYDAGRQMAEKILESTSQPAAGAK